MLMDTQVIAATGTGPAALQVLAQRHEVLWRDCSAIALHPVWAHGMPLAMQRAVRMPGGRLVLFDVRRLAPALDAELRSLPGRDQVGAVFFTLRAAFPTAAACIAAIEEHAALGAWWPVGDDGLVWHPRPPQAKPAPVVPAYASVQRLPAPSAASALPLDWPPRAVAAAATGKPPIRSLWRHA